VSVKKVQNFCDSCFALLISFLYYLIVIPVLFIILFLAIIYSITSSGVKYLIKGIKYIINKIKNKIK